MKILLFTHEQDIDGMGCAVLGTLAFSDITIVPCKTFEITDKFNSYIESKNIYNYDKVIVTDLCVKEPVLSYINDNNEIKSKTIILDHHKTEIEEGNDKYDFVNIIVEKDGIKRSGTSLFYDYLTNNNYLEKSNILDTYAEWTRQYDVWDWKPLNNYKARNLHILFEMLGYEKYIELSLVKLRNEKELTYNEYEQSVIDEFNNKFKNDIENILDGMKIFDIEINGITYKVGYVMCPYKYRNDINEEVKKHNIDIDVVGMIMTDTETVSYRLVKDVDASIIGVYFGGKGHKGAATNLQSNEKFKYILESFKNV